nr:immunoglobulin light chain junction region [Macaca mulatta]
VYYCSSHAGSNTWVF